MPEEKTEALGRFGHHPDAATDFAVEVDAIEGMVADYKAGLATLDSVQERIEKAMRFGRGGLITVMALAAKQALRAAEADLKKSIQSVEYPAPWHLEGPYDLDGHRWGPSIAIVAANGHCITVGYGSGDWPMNAEFIVNITNQAAGLQCPARIENPKKGRAC